MNKTKASTETFFEQIRSGKLLNDKQRVYAYIKKHPGITLNDLSRGLKMLIQTVSARLSDLMDMGVVEVIATTTRIGNVSISYDSQLIVVEEETRITENKLKRSKIKFKRAIKAILRFKEHLDDDTRDSLSNLLKK